MVLRYTQYTCVHISLSVSNFSFNFNFEMGLGNFQYKVQILIDLYFSKCSNKCASLVLVSLCRLLNALWYFFISVYLCVFQNLLTFLLEMVYFFHLLKYVHILRTTAHLFCFFPNCKSKIYQLINHSIQFDCSN